MLTTGYCQIFKCSFDSNYFTLRESKILILHRKFELYNILWVKSLHICEFIIVIFMNKTIFKLNDN